MFSPQCYSSEAGHKQQKYVAVIYTDQPRHYNHLLNVLQVSCLPRHSSDLSWPPWIGLVPAGHTDARSDWDLGNYKFSWAPWALGRIAPEECRCREGMCLVCSGVFLGCLSKKSIGRSARTQGFFFFLPAEHCMVTRGWMLFPSAVSGFNVVAHRCDVTAWSKSLIKYRTVIQFSCRTEITFTMAWLK